MEKYIGKKILAYGANKHKPCNYSSIGYIEKIENDFVYVYNEKNPKGYKRYTMLYEKFIRFINEKLLKLK